MSAREPLPLEALAARVPDGATLAIVKDDSGPALALTRALLRRRVRDLHLVTVPIAGLQADVLIGAGAVRSVETSGISLGEFGPAPRFTDAVKAGRLQVIDATCPAIYAALQAGAKGAPFMPLPGVLGSDLVARHPGWATVTDPFDPSRRWLAVRALRPDVAIFHARCADAQGNVWVGRDRDPLLLAHASVATLVTVERIVPGCLLDDEATAAGTVPATYVEAIAVVPGGDAPGDRPGTAGAAIAAYAAQARTDAGFAAWLESWLASTPCTPAAPTA